MRKIFMANQMEPPYVCHIFVCTNNRDGERRSCADQNSPLLKKALKEEIGNRGWKSQVRVSTSGCMGLCGKGPNVIIYPQKIWFPEASIDDAGLIISKVEEILSQG
jgi:(2Fe-2S) ferredoxin